jgi:hypothetical protein
LANNDDDDDKNAAIAAAIVLGVAAVAHNKHHHKNGHHYKDANQDAEFERGYNDALYGGHYDTYSSNDAYSAGYQVGEKDNNNRVSHNRRHRKNSEGHGAPAAARRACIAATIDKWGADFNSVVATGGQKFGDNEYVVEVTAGHSHARCEVSGSGNVFSLKPGTL